MVRLLLLLGLLLPSVALAEAHGDDDDSAGDDDDSAGDDDDSAGDDDDSAGDVEPLAPPEPDPRDARIEELESRLDALETLTAPKPKRRAIPRLDVQLGGSISSDVRFQVEERSQGGWYAQQTLPVGFVRNENIANLTMEAEISRFRGVVDLDFVLVGLPPDPDGLPGLSRREGLHPYRIEAHAAYIHARDLFFPGLDVRFGQQLVQWGVGDQFNPTNLLNADDLEDPLQFGEQQANLMLKVDWTPLPNRAPNWTFSVVAVPTFRPALVPESAALGLGAVDRLPFLDEDLRYRVHAETEFARRAGLPTIVGSTRTELPDFNLRNVQLAIRMAATVFDQDIAISFYRGFDDFPVPFQNFSTQDSGYAGCENDPPPPEVREDEPGEDEDCISGVINTETSLTWPRIHVLGLNMTGEIPVAGIGYRVEVGVYFPERRSIRLFNDPILIAPAGEYDYDGDGEPGGTPPEVVSNEVFAKWVLGFDYTVGAHLMINAMWVHGLVDEFGSGDFIRPRHWSVRKGEALASNPGEESDLPPIGDCALGGDAEQCASEILRPKLADYLVLGLDLNFARRAGLVRVFTIWDLSGYHTQSWDVATAERTNTFHHPFSKKGFSAVIYPSIAWNFGFGFELSAGALLQLGQTHTKFGDPAAGGHQVFVKGKYSF